ncbi:MAG: 50S ribosomal protein L4 [Verrucomicrobiota bacterium]
MKENLTILKGNGEQSGTLAIKPTWVELTKGTQAVHETVVAYLAAQRAGTASTKTRAQVRGGGAKPYRQKGTGRARAGSSRSPIWGGGGVIFGPKPRSYNKKVNKKVKRLALKRAFSERLNADEVAVVEDIDIAAPKTKEFVNFLDAVGLPEDVLVVVDKKTDNQILASRNLAKTDLVSVMDVNTYSIMRHQMVVFTTAAFNQFIQRICPEEVNNE